MKEDVTKALSESGLVVSVGYVIVLVATIAENWTAGSCPSAIRTLVMFCLLASPFACVLTLCGAAASVAWPTIRKRWTMLGLNSLGVCITGWFGTGLAHLVRLGPINPG